MVDFLFASSKSNSHCSHWKSHEGMTELRPSFRVAQPVRHRVGRLLWISVNCEGVLPECGLEHAAACLHLALMPPQRRLPRREAACSCVAE